ncbi:type III-B CRISPR module-associated protein Cmr5 [Herpetosiphon geysericola]|uniref:type III-B CRISPR module-associated protein Cmr5 n=1 Tax=Herpetosiphon geysericola TaxID=70996 RepID=UPI0006C8EC7E|nr:type III-B CRISPR module-associated protein Cmr5 [Herpetosiphon geysericola]
MSNSVFQTRDQKFAASAYAHIETVLKQYPKPVDKPNTEKSKEEKSIEAKYQTSRNVYGSMAHKLPILIRNAGLVQALAFAQSRDKSEINLFLEHLAITINFTCKAQDFAAKVAELELAEYMYRTQQALDALLWYKRFVQSILDIDPSNAIQ